jgi:transforming growth factor-beta-induced protein
MSFQTSISRLAIGFALISSAVSGCATRASTAFTDYPKPTDTAVDVLARDKTLQTFSNLIKSAELEDTVANRSLTIFAPTDEAFQALSSADLEKMAKDSAYLELVLKHHMMAGASSIKDMHGSNGSNPVTMVSGKPADLARTGSYISLGDALVFEPNIHAGRSIIQKIDRVVLP